MADLTVPLDEEIVAGDTGHAGLHADANAYINALIQEVDDRPTGAEVTTMLGQAPTLDDLASGVYLGDIATNRYYLMVAPFALRVAAVSLICGTAVASSTTVYWTIALRRIRGGTATSFASKTTNAADGAGGQAIAANAEWNFDNIAFSGTVSQLAKGDAVAIELVATGAAPTLARTNVTLRYVPL